MSYTVPDKSKQPFHTAGGRGILLLCVLLCLASTARAAEVTGSGPVPFEISLIELPVGDTPSLNPTKLAADGTVVGNLSVPGDNGVPAVHVVRLPPGADTFEDLDGAPAYSFTNLLPLVTADGSVIFNNRIEIDDDEMQMGVPSSWTETEPWQPLPGLSLLTSILLGMTADGSYIVGRGRDEFLVEDQPWIWSEAGGQQVLPLSPQREGGEGYGVADDGSVVAGAQWDYQGTGFDPRRDFGTRWVDGQPEILFDDLGYELGPAFACSADCDVVTGSRQGGDPDFDHPNWGQAWYWTEATGAVYLGTLPQAEEGLPYYATDINADGSIIIGTYSILADDQPIPLYRGFIWTESTGMVAISDLLEAHDLMDDDWYDMLPSAITPDGDMILLTGMDTDLNPKSAILDIEPAGTGPGQPVSVPALDSRALILMSLLLALMALRHVRK